VVARQEADSPCVVKSFEFGFKCLYIYICVCVSLLDPDDVWISINGMDDHSTHHVVAMSWKPLEKTATSPTWAVWGQSWRKTILVRKSCYNLVRPPVMGRWFINHRNSIDISTINHSEIGVMFTNWTGFRTGGHHLVGKSWWMLGGSAE